jgi:Tfp pilus assembly protein PilZ
VDLQYHRLDGANTASGSAKASVVTANIGVGGAFLLTKDPEVVGTTLAIALRVPDRPDELLLEAEVRWAISEGSTRTPGVPGAGMGVKFAPLEVDALLALQDYFSTLQG